MAVPRGVGRLVVDLSRRHGWSGAVLQLGRQAVYLTEAELSGRRTVPWPVRTYADDQRFFGALGFTRVEAADLPGVGDPDVCLDLNSDLPDDLAGSYDAVYDGGTVGSVFDVPRALRSVEALLREGGRAVHVVACDGYVDEGFYAMSPRLLHEWYSGRGYHIEASIIVEHSRRWRRGGIRAWHYVPGCLDSLTIAGFERGALLYLIVARRPAAPVDAVPYLPRRAGRSEALPEGVRRRIAPGLLPLLPSRVLRIVPRRLPPGAGRW